MFELYWVASWLISNSRHHPEGETHRSTRNRQILSCTLASAWLLLFLSLLLTHQSDFLQLFLWSVSDLYVSANPFIHVISLCPSVVPCDSNFSLSSCIKYSMYYISHKKREELNWHVQWDIYELLILLIFWMDIEDNNKVGREYVDEDFSRFIKFWLQM